MTPPGWVLFQEGGLCTNLNKYFNGSLFMSSVYAPPPPSYQKEGGQWLTNRNISKLIDYQLEGGIS